MAIPRRLARSNLRNRKLEMEVRIVARRNLVWEVLARWAMVDYPIRKAAIWTLTQSTHHQAITIINRHESPKLALRRTTFTQIYQSARCPISILQIRSIKDNNRRSSKGITSTLRTYKPMTAWINHPILTINTKAQAVISNLTFKYLYHSFLIFNSSSPIFLIQSLLWMRSKKYSMTVIKSWQMALVKSVQIQWAWRKKLFNTLKMTFNKNLTNHQINKLVVSLKTWFTLIQWIPQAVITEIIKTRINIIHSLIILNTTTIANRVKNRSFSITLTSALTPLIIDLNVFWLTRINVIKKALYEIIWHY